MEYSKIPKSVNQTNKKQLMCHLQRASHPVGEAHPLNYSRCTCCHCWGFLVFVLFLPGVNYKLYPCTLMGVHTHVHLEHVQPLSGLYLYPVPQMREQTGRVSELGIGDFKKWALKWLWVGFHATM